MNNILFYKYLTFLIYTFHTLQEQFSDFHVLTNILKFSKESIFLNWFEI